MNLEGLIYTYILSDPRVEMVSNSLTVKSIVRGYHVYKTVWNPEINDKFDVCIDQYNEKDRYAMKIKIDDEIVGHVHV